jgi:hypothetical protein
MFVCLTRVDGRDIRINTDHIIYYELSNVMGKVNTTTSIALISNSMTNWVTVTETPEEIDEIVKHIK